MLKQINMNEQLDNLENPPFKIKIGNLLLVALTAICSLHFLDKHFTIPKMKSINLGYLVVNKIIVGFKLKTYISRKYKVTIIERHFLYLLILICVYVL